MKTRVLLILCLFLAATVWAQTQPAAGAEKSAPAKAAQNAPEAKKAAPAAKAGCECPCCKSMAKTGDAAPMACCRGKKNGEGCCCKEAVAANKDEKAGCCCMKHKHAAAASKTAVNDPVCNMKIEPASAVAKTDYKGKTYYFCNPGCLEKFKAAPEKYIKSS